MWHWVKKEGIKMLNRAEEDYIKTIYELTIQDEKDLVRTNEVSDYFGYTDQSVNEMIKRLSQKKLLNFIPYKGVSLTQKGKKEAIRMIRAHRIWEVFLTDKLGFSWESVHEDAERLEHATSDKVLNKLYEFIGKPDYCQHGNPIPDEKGYIKKSATHSLDQCQVNQVFKISRVLDYKELLIYLNQEDIKLNDLIEVLEIDQFNGIMKVRHKKRVVTLSIKTAEMLFGQVQ